MQNYKENIDIKVLMRYLEGNASDEDAYMVKQWFTNADSEQELFEKSLRFWDEISLKPDTKEYSGTHILDQIHHKIKIEEGVFFNRNKKETGFINYLIRIAAIMFIPVLIASLLFYFQNKSSHDIVSYSEIHAPYGTRTDFNLPDGSTGRLNGGSSLKFPTQFSRKVREVSLSGEAYFNVIPNPKKSFIVSTKNIDVKVFGTSFNVMAYADDNLTEVTLEKGKVEVFRKTNNTIKSIGVLKPNELCRYNLLSDSSKILPANTAEKLSWLDGKLTFKYEPFDEVIHKINRWYNANILIMDKMLSTYVYYGTFKDETLDEVLKLLQLTAPIKYRDFGREKKPDGSFEKRQIEIYYKK